MPNQAIGNQQLSVQVENQLTTQPAADAIPQLDGMAGPDADEEPSSEEVYFSFTFKYAEDDIQLKELIEGNLVLSLANLVSSGLENPKTADHLCILVFMLPAKSKFSRPEMPGFPDFYKDVKRL